MNRRQRKKLLTQTGALMAYLFTNRKRDRLTSERRSIWLYKRIMGEAMGKRPRPKI